MYTILIVDDEPLIRKGLVSGFNWAAMGFSVCGDAADGEEACAMIRALKPDVLMTDVSMSRMDGLTLLRKLREEGNDIPALIVSGYDDFEFARTAMRYGSIEYLLKPLVETEIREVMERVRRLLDEKTKKTSRNLPGVQPEQPQVVSPKISLLAFLQGGSEDTDLLSSYLAPYGFRGGKIVTIAMLTARGAEYGVLEERVRGFSWDGRENTPVPLRFQGDMLLLFPQETGKVFPALDRFLRTLGEVRVFCVMSSCLFEELPAVYMKMLADPARYYYLTPNQVHPYPAYEQKNKKPELQKPVVILEELREGGEDALTTILIKVRSALLSALPSSDTAAALLAECFGTVLDDAHIPTEDGQKGWFFALYRRLSQCDGVFALLDTLKEMLLPAARMFSAQRKETDTIEAVRQYIDTHFGEDLSLTHLSDVFFMNASYLSALFSRRIGKTLSSYIEDVRLRNAEGMLLEGRKSVAVIGKSCGYPNARYFARIFKERTGLTPSQYRKRHLQETLL